MIAHATGLSRRAADAAIEQGRVTVNGHQAQFSDRPEASDIVAVDGIPITTAVKIITIMLHKPTGYVVSRNGQGSPTIYDLLPADYHTLKPIGRLDKYSSGLLLLTNDGALANNLAHPSHHKHKLYQVTLYKPLQPLHCQMITDHGVQLEDGPSRLQLQRLHDGNDLAWQVGMHEGRNRQIRRTFAALGYTVKTLHRTQFGNYQLDGLSQGQYRTVNDQTSDLGANSVQ